MFDYNVYLKNDSVAFEEAVNIYNSIFKILDYKDDYLHELWKEIIDSILVYANMRINWNYFSREEKHEKDNLKAFHKLAEQLELDTNWRKNLVHQKIENNGKIL